jgi:hypothetical protein
METNLENLNNLIVCFHIGRGGRFNNSGFKSFITAKDINQVIKFDDDKSSNFITYENEHKYYKTLKNYPNLSQKFDECRDADDFTWFENKFRWWELGEKIYTDCDGNPLGVKVENDGTGCVNRDFAYDTTYCCFIEDCNNEELRLIYNYSGYVDSRILEEVKTLMIEREIA